MDLLFRSGEDFNILRFILGVPFNCIAIMLLTFSSSDFPLFMLMGITFLIPGIWMAQPYKRMGVKNKLFWENLFAGLSLTLVGILLVVVALTGEDSSMFRWVMIGFGAMLIFFALSMFRDTREHQTEFFDQVISALMVSALGLSITVWSIDTEQPLPLVIGLVIDAGALVMWYRMLKSG